MKRFAILLLFLIIATVSADPIYSSTHSVECSGGCTVIANKDMDWRSGSDLSKTSGQVYTDGASGHITLTAPGPVQYQTLDKLDASNANVYTGSSYLDAQNGLVTSDSLSMTDIAPNITDIACTAGSLGAAKGGYVTGNTPNSQYAVGEKTAIGQSMNVQSAKFINDAEFDLSGQAVGQGSSMYVEEFSAGAKTGASKNSSVVNYRNEVRSHHATFGNQSADLKVKSDDSWGDFSPAFVTKAALNITNSTNQTEQ